MTINYQILELVLSLVQIVKQICSIATFTPEARSGAIAEPGTDRKRTDSATQEIRHFSWYFEQWECR